MLEDQIVYIDSRKYYRGVIGSLSPNEVFVFGSNPEGRHGAGAAKVARAEFGAKYGQGRGLQGNSYGLVTKNLKDDYRCDRGLLYPESGKLSVTRQQIIANIIEMYTVARSMNGTWWYVAYNMKSSNLNGYSSEDMMRMFFTAAKYVGLPDNIVFHESYAEYNDTTT